MLLSPILSRSCPMDSSMLTRLVLWCIVHNHFCNVHPFFKISNMYIAIKNNGSNTMHTRFIQFIVLYVPLWLFLPYIIATRH
jgi:hypothetical protein